MSKIERMLFSYNPTNKEKTFSLGNQPAVNKLQMPFTNIIPVIQEIKPQQIYHTGAKYGASKYISSLQSGKMHKLL
jgi:hypothetical protein